VNNVHALTKVKEGKEINFKYEISVAEQLRLPSFFHVLFGTLSMK